MKVELRSAHGDITITLRPDGDDEGSVDQALLDLLGQVDERGSRPRVTSTAWNGGHCRGLTLAFTVVPAADPDGD